MRPRSLLALLTLLGCRRDPPVPQQDRSDGAIPSLTAPRVRDDEVTLDGRIAEPAWRRAGRTQGFVHPGTGAPVPGSKVNAEAWALWSDTRLLIAVRVWDARPVEGFAATEVDPHVWERSTGVELMLQPGDPGDNRDYFEVQVAFGGALWATRFDDYNQPVTRDRAGAMRFGHQDWSPAVRSAQTVARDHYDVELAIPWSDLAGTRAPTPPRAGDAWRANLYSFRDGQRDSLAWSPILGEGNFHRARRFGRITFGP